MGQAGLGQPRRTIQPLAVTLATACLVVAPACTDFGTSDSDLGHFAQVGEIRVEVETGLPPDEDGQLQQSLTWESTGAWTLQERISYRGHEGDVTTRRSRGDPSPLAAHYQTLIRQLNEVRGLQLFIDDLPQDLEPDCGRGDTQFTLTLVDEAVGDSARWERCADGPLFTVRSGEAGPDPTASRVITAAQLTRDFTLGDSERSVYEGSHPFATLDRGEDSPAEAPAPQAFLGEAGAGAPPEWDAFWSEHAEGEEIPVDVDWDREMVILAAVGARQEAGDSVVVRRILSVDQEDRVEVFKRIPGDFCSPAARSHYPYHIVVAPRSADRVAFADIQEERVPCGVFP